MKDQFLKIAGVKSEAAFYKKYKTEKEFFSAHPEAKKLIKKAQSGVGIPNILQTPQYGPDNALLTIPGANINEPIYNPTLESGLPTYNNNFDSNFTISQNQQTIGETPIGSGSSSSFNPAMLAGAINQIPSLVNAFDSEKQQKKKLQQQDRIAGVQEMLSQSTDVDKKRRKERFDNVISTNSVFPSQGTGYDILRAAKDGAYIPIAQDGINNFGPMYDIYSDQGYVPFGSTDNIKTYQDGGGFSSVASPLANIGNTAIGSAYNNNAGYQAGEFAGQFSDFIVPGSSTFVKPITGFIGGAADQAFGNAGDINRLSRSLKGKQNRIFQNSMGKQIQEQNNSYMKDGGYVSNDWTPQLITKFGDHTAKDYYDYAHEDMPSYRSGGHLKDLEYTPVSESGLKTYQTGGELQTHWGGEVEPVSYNPFSPGKGLTYNAYGNSHFEKDHQGRTGIGLSVMQDGGYSPEADVEIEKQEPISVTQDGAVVYGNLNTNKDLLKSFDLPEEYANQKVKNIVNKTIVPKEQKYTKELEKIVSTTPNSNTVFGALSDKTKEAQHLGLTMKLKALAEDKEKLAAYQDHIHQTTDYLSNLLGKEVSQEKFAKNGEISHTLAKGELPKNAKNGKTIKKAAEGGGADGSKLTKEQYQELMNEYIKAKAQGKGNDVKEFQKKFHQYFPKEAVSIIQKEGKNRGITDQGKKLGLTPEELEKGENTTKILGSNEEGYFGPRTEQYWAKINDIYNTSAENKPATPAAKPVDNTELEQIPVKQKFPWESLATNLIRGFQPAYHKGLSPTQLTGEIMALNSQPYSPTVGKINPMQETPYKYSADAERNAILSQGRQASKMAGNNPAAQAAIAAQMADILGQVSSKEYNINQQGYQGVYNRNINSFNDANVRNVANNFEAAKLKSMADANTERDKIYALQSMGAKEAQNERENMDYNMGMALHPDFTFGPDGRVIKLPRYVDFDVTGKMASNTSKKQQAPEGFKYYYNEDGTVEGMKKKKEESQEGKTIKKKNVNGNIVKAFKTF